jgi:hypothetical protein
MSIIGGEKSWRTRDTNKEYNVIGNEKEKGGA